MHPAYWFMTCSFKDERNFHLKYALIFFVSGVLLEVAHFACLQGNLYLLASINSAFAISGFFLMFVCLCRAFISHLNYREYLHRGMNIEE